MSTSSPQNWPDLAIGLYDKLTERGAEITYEFDQVSVGVPATASESSPSAAWSLNGTLRVRTRDNAGS